MTDREAWVQAQAAALYEDLRAKEAAAKEAETPTIEGDSITGGVFHGDVTLRY